VSNKSIEIAKRIIQRGEDTFGAGCGVRELQWVLDAFARRESGEVIAQRFGVTRQLVSQWRQALGDETYNYAPHKGVKALLPKIYRQAV